MQNSLVVGKTNLKTKLFFNIRFSGTSAVFELISVPSDKYYYRIAPHPNNSSAWTVDRTSFCVWETFLDGSFDNLFEAAQALELGLFS